MSWEPNQVDMNKSKFSVYRIGRSPGVDIRIDDDSVSRVHAELIATPSGSYYLTDCASSGGSYVAQNGEWRRIRQEFINPTDAILLGHYQTTASALIAMAAQREHRSEGGTSLPVGPVRRNVDTGEIIGEED